MSNRPRPNNSSKSSKGAANKPNQQATTQNPVSPQPSQSSNIDIAQLKSSSYNNRIALFALLISILTFIFGGGIVGYFNHQQQSQQSQIDDFKTQIAIQHDYSLAHLEFQSLGLKNESLSPENIGLGRGIRITNLGPATANNIQITATIIYLNKIWGIAGFNANQIGISSSNPAIINSISRTITTIDGAEHIQGNNAITINLKPLAQNQSIDIHFNPPSSNAQGGRSVNLTLYSKYRYQSFANAGDTDVLVSGLTLVDAYFDKLLEDAELYTSISCDCVGANSRPIQPLIISVSTSYSLPSIDPNNKNTLVRNFDYFQFNFQVNVQYSPPPGSKPFTINSPLYLLAGQVIFSKPISTDTYIPAHQALIWPDVQVVPCDQSQCLQLIGP